MPVTASTARGDFSSASVKFYASSLSDNNRTSPSAPVAGKKRNSTTSSRGVASLTPDQLAKKRANDREAQRAIRERTKNQIEFLENRIKELESQQPFQDLQTAVRQKEAVEAENAEIRRKLSSVLSIIQPILQTQIPNDLASPPPGFNLPENIAQVNGHAPRDAVRSSDASIGGVDALSPGSVDRQARPVSTYRSYTAASSWTPFNSQKNTLAHGLDFGESGERLGLGFLLDPSQQVTKLKDIQGSPNSYVQFPRRGSTHLVAHTAPVQNIPPTCPMDGILLDFLQSRQRELTAGALTQKLVGPAYPSVSSLLNPERSIYSHPLSKVFTDIISKFPDISALPDQVAVVYVMFLIMRWQIYPTQENYDRLPEWAIPRPSQLFIPHPAWLDYLPWPRMREKMVSSYQNYSFENWFIPYTTTLSLNWPYEPTDCLLSTNESEELMINPVFERHLRNLENWSLGPAFARAFPELVDTTRIKDARRSSDELSGAQMWM